MTLGLDHRLRLGSLSGLVVADFSRVLAGPYCTMLLADLGAEVIKVESAAGDDTRHWVPPQRGDTGTYYLSINRNKRSIVLDLADADDLQVAHRLAEHADVVVQNFKPGGLAKFGLDYDSVRARRADVIYCSISGFGADKGAALPGYDLLVQAVSGLMSLTGSPDGPPYRAGISVFDVMTGLHSAIGILAALRHRDRTGQGQHVETNLLSTALSTLVNQTSAYVAGGVVPQRMGNAHLSLFPYEPLPTADGELIVISGNDAQFRKLAAALGIPEVIEDERFATVGARNANRELLRPLLLDRLATRSAQQWFEILTTAGIPCGPINDIGGGVELATELGLDPVVLAGDVPTVRNPIRMSETPPCYDLPPPRLDEHGTQVRHWLGVGPVSPHSLPPAGEAPVPLPDASAERPQMTDHAKYPTSLGISSVEGISLFGRNLSTELIGRVSFGHLAFQLITLEQPTDQQARVFEAVLVALADHGFTPTAIAARLTYLSAPDAIQGALAAGLLGGGSRFLGVSEDTGAFLADALAGVDQRPATDAEWDNVARTAIRKRRAAGGFIPGLGHHLHKNGDPRTPVITGIAQEEGMYGPHLALFEAIGRVAPEVLGKVLPLNGAGVCGAALADLGIPIELLRGVVLLARCAGLLGHVAEEIRRPIASQIFRDIESRAVYRPRD